MRSTVRLTLAGLATTALLLGGTAAQAETDTATATEAPAAETVVDPAADDAATTDEAPATEEPADEAPATEEPGTEVPAEETPADGHEQTEWEDEGSSELPEGDPSLNSYWEAVIAAEWEEDVACTRLAGTDPWTSDADYEIVVGAFNGTDAEGFAAASYYPVAAGDVVTFNADVAYIFACNPGTPNGDVDTDGGSQGDDQGTDEGTETGKPGDDAGEPIGPIVQTDVPVEGGTNGALALSALGGLALAGAGLRLARR